MSFLLKLHNFIIKPFNAKSELIWHKQLFRKYLLNTKNIFFNEFVLDNLISKVWQFDKLNKQSVTDINYNLITELNTDLWSQYVMLWRFEEQQRLLDLVFKKSRYYKNLDTLKLKKQTPKASTIQNLNQDLNLWYQLGYSFDFLNSLNNNFPIKNYLHQLHSTSILEDSLDYQHKLNIHLVGVLDYLSGLYEKDMFVQTKTIRGIYFRFFRETIYPLFSCSVLTLMSIFTFLTEILYLITTIIAVPLLIILFCYLIFTDSIVNFDFETVWLQFDFFEFIYTSFLLHVLNNFLIFDYDIAVYFNNFCWFCIYLFFFFMLIFEGAGWMSHYGVEEDNIAQYLYTDEGTVYEDIHDTCNLFILELMLDLSDHDFTNIDLNSYYIFSDDADDFRDYEYGFTNLNQFAVQLFTGGIGILYMMQTVIQQDDIEDNEFHDLSYYDGLTRHNQDYEDEPELEFGSSLSYIYETDTSYGLYEYPLDSVNISISKYGSDYNMFDEEGGNIEAFISSPAHGFEVFSDSSFNYFLEYSLGCSIFDFFMFCIILLYCLIYFKIYYDWEIWIYREYTARNYFQRISYLGWQHSLSNDEVISDEDIINHITTLEQTSLSVGGYEQLQFSRDISPHITDIEYLFEDIEDLIDFNNEFLMEEDSEFVDENELIAIESDLEEEEDENSDFFEFEEVSDLSFEDRLLFENDFSYNLNVNATNSSSPFTSLDFFFHNFKNIHLLLLTLKKIKNYFEFISHFLEYSTILIFFYNNISRIPNGVLRFSILQLLYFNIHLKKLLLFHNNKRYKNLSFLDLLLLKIKIKNVTSSYLILEIENEIIEVIINDFLKTSLDKLFENFFDEYSMDLYDLDFFTTSNHFENNSYNNLKSFYTNLGELVKKYFIPSEFMIPILSNNPIFFYSKFFQINLLGTNNILILDEENDVDLFFSDYEDSINYFHHSIMEVDLIDKSESENNNIDFKDPSYDEVADDLEPTTVYDEDDNPYDLYSYDFFFGSKNYFVNKSQSLRLDLLIKNDVFITRKNSTQNILLEKDYFFYFNNFFLYSWSNLLIENNIKPQETLYNVTAVVDLEFDTNYVENEDDELYEDEHFLVPNQRLLLHSLINNFRYEYNCWLDGWGTWHFLNYNNFEGTLNSFFDYEIFHADDEFDTDEEDMMEMNIPILSDDLSETYTDNFSDEPSDFLDGVLDLSAIYDDLDDFEEDFLETSFLVEKPYISIIIFVLFFECLTIFFIEYYFILYVFLEPENGDNVFSDLLDFRYNGIFYDMLKLNSYHIYLFLFDYFHFDQFYFNEVFFYQLLYFSIFAFLDEPGGITGMRWAYLQIEYVQDFVLYFYIQYENYLNQLLAYLFPTDILNEDDFKSLSEQYYDLYIDAEKEDDPERLTYYYLYLYYYYLYEPYEAFMAFLGLLLQYCKSFFFFIKYLFYLKTYYLLKVKYLIIIFLNFIFMCLFSFFFDTIIDYWAFVVVEDINDYLILFYLYIWKFKLEIFLSFDHYISLVYLIYSGVIITFFEKCVVQIFTLQDMLILYKNNGKFFYFLNNLHHTQTYQFINNTITSVSLLNKEITQQIGSFTKIILQFNNAYTIQRIIIENFFFFFSSKNSYNCQYYLYLYFNYLTLNNFNIFIIFQIFLLISLSFITKIFLFLSYIMQFYNYDLYYIYLYYFLRCMYMTYCLLSMSYQLNSMYSINRNEQFDDKTSYIKETINLHPEILYDIETLTFINNTYDSYVYWF